MRLISRGILVIFGMLAAILVAVVPSTSPLVFGLVLAYALAGYALVAYSTRRAHLAIGEAPRNARQQS